MEGLAHFILLWYIAMSLQNPKGDALDEDRRDKGLFN